MFAGTARAAHPSPAPLRIRLSVQVWRAVIPAINQAVIQASPARISQLRLDLFKRRGGVIGQPLLLDIATTPATLAQAQPRSAEVAEVRPPRRIERLALNRPPSFHRHYPVGAPQARIWNRALARADELRRVPAPDPRSAQPSLRIDARAVVPAAGDAGIFSR
jgi:hypothetical protein